MIGIYKITSPSGKVYIGQSIDIERRFKRYENINTSKGQIKLYRSFIKYTFNTHIFEIIEECLFEDLNIRERYWQDYYDVLNKGLNCVLTETNILPRVISKETKIKLSNAGKERIFSEESRLKMSKSQSGENHPNFGKNLSEAHCKNISLSNTGNIKTQEDKDQIRIRMKGNKHSLNTSHNKNRFILDTSNGIFYYSVGEASRIFDINIKTLYNYLTNHRANKTTLIFV